MLSDNLADNRILSSSIIDRLSGMQNSSMNVGITEEWQETFTFLEYVSVMDRNAWSSL